MGQKCRNVIDHLQAVSIRIPGDVAASLAAIIDGEQSKPVPEALNRVVPGRRVANDAMYQDNHWPIAVVCVGQLCPCRLECGVSAAERTIKRNFLPEPEQDDSGDEIPEQSSPSDRAGPLPC